MNEGKALATQGTGSHQIFSCTHRVSYAECTLGNHVYHSRFLDILERARGEFFRSLGCSFHGLQEQNAVFPVTYCEMRFLAMAHYDDVLSIDLWLTELGRARFACAGQIRNAEGVGLFESVTRFGCTGIEGRPHRIPEQLTRMLREYLAPINDHESKP